jgi:hypothetical protein
MFAFVLFGVSTKAQAQFADWISADPATGTATGTLNSVAVTMSGFPGYGPFLDTTYVGFDEYSAFPSSYQEYVDYAAQDDWTAKFSQPVSGLLLYLVGWRGPNGEIDPVIYIFDQPFTVLSGLHGITNVGNTLSAPDDALHGTFASGILRFDGPITSLSVVSNSPSINRQGLTFALVPEPSGKLLAGLALLCLALARFYFAGFRGAVNRSGSRQ